MSGGLWQRFAAVAQRRSHAPALIQGDHVLSFEQLLLRATHAAAHQAAHGLGPGDRCLFRAANGPEFAIGLLAAWRVGAIAVLVNADAPISHLAHAASVTSPTLIVTDKATADSAARITTCPVLAFADRDSAIAPPSAPAVAVDEMAPASILFTSGSTGLPKGVVQSHANLLAGCDMVAGHLGFRPDDRILCPVPWSFDYGFGQLLTTTMAGLTQIIPEAPNPFALCEAIARHRPTILAGIPSLFALLLLGVSPLRETDRTSLRLVTSSGGKIPPAVFADMLEVFADCDISLNYGMTETYRSTSLPPSLAATRPDSVGMAYPGVTIRIVREDDSETATDEIGEVVHCGVGTFLGYWGEPEATARRLRPCPVPSHQRDGTPCLGVYTGDLGCRDADGQILLKGRRDRLMKSMGVRVSPEEIETCLRDSGLVQDAVVFGRPHDLLGEMVVAAVIPVKGMTEPVRAMKLYARGAMSPSMQPRLYHLLDSFPLTPNGKIDLPALKALSGDGAA